MSHTNAAPLRTTYWVFQIGSKLARSACGTRRNVRAAARCEMAGGARMPPVASAPAPAAVFRNVRRSMIFPTTALNQIFRDESPPPQYSVSDFVECLPAVGAPPPAKLAGFRHISLAAHYIN